MDAGQASPGLGRRLGARLIDGVLLAVLGAVWGAALDYDLVWLVAHALLIFGYFAGGDALFGGTIGKALLGMRVESPDGGHPSLGQAARREAFVLVGAVPFIGPIVAMGLWVAIAVTARANGGRGLHDRWAGGTRVVRR